MGEISTVGLGGVVGGKGLAGGRSTLPVAAGAACYGALSAGWSAVGSAGVFCSAGVSDPVGAVGSAGVSGSAEGSGGEDVSGWATGAGASPAGGVVSGAGF